MSRSTSPLPPLHLRGSCSYRLRRGCRQELKVVFVSYLFCFLIVKLIVNDKYYCMHTKKRLRRSITLRSNRCARHCLTAASERHGLTMMSNKWGGKNRSAPTANDGLTRPASECRAGRSSEAGVCQGNAGHCVGINVITAAKIHIIFQ